MQLVSHYLQRPNKSRLPSEKRIVLFYDICFILQATCLLVHIVRTIDSCKQTLAHNIMVSEPFALSPFLAYKVQGCSYTVVESTLYAFSSVPVLVDDHSFEAILSDLLVEMRLAMFIGGAAVVLGLFNRSLVENNIFAILTVRNMVIWKDIVSAMELFFLCYVLQIAVACGPPQRILRDYFIHCGVTSRTTLPFVDVICLYVLSAGGYLTYVVSGILYLIHTLPKYGVLNEEEIEEYKERLRRRQAADMELKGQLQQAKEAHARLHFEMMERTYIDGVTEGSKKKKQEVIL